MAAQCAASAVVSRVGAPRPAKALKAAGARPVRSATSSNGARRVGGRGVIRATGAPKDEDVVREPRPEYIPNKIDDPDYVRVFDTTLRDGEQSPGTNPTRRFDHPRDDPRFGATRRRRKPRTRGVLES